MAGARRDARLLRSISLLGLLFPGCFASGGPWEWAGVFNFPSAGTYSWTAEKVGGAYADATMKIVAVSASSADAAGLEGSEASALTLWNGAGAWTQATNGAQIPIGSRRQLVFDGAASMSTFQVQIVTPGPVTFFCEHFPTEFEATQHYLHSATNVAVEPSAQEPDGAGGHAHGHGDSGHPWEWAGVFDLSKTGHYLWSAEKKEDGTYADATMKFVAVSASTADAAGLEGSEASALALWNGAGAWTQATNGAQIQIGTRRELVFDTDAWISFFKLMVNTAGPVAIFAQHFPIEFETNVHYLKDKAGEDVEPAAQEPDPDAKTEKEKDKWGVVILGAFLTCLPAILALLLIPCLATAKLAEKVTKFVPAVHSFASGVVFAAAVFLLLPEGLHLAGAGQAEATGAALWGSFILLGWFTGAAIHHVTDTFLPPADPKTVDVAASGAQTVGKADPEGVAPEVKADPKAAKPYDDNWKAIAGVVFFGDLFHNFSDGLVIGTAFRSCSTTFAWTLIGVTFGHELPQEMADIAVLTTRAGFGAPKALGFNFVSSLSTVLGALITYGTEVGMNGEGCILAYGAGVYLFLAVTELGPNVVELGRGGLVQSALRLLPFLIGCLSIGLFLLGHEHCVPEDGSDPHAGHNHGGGAEDPHAGHNHR